METQMNESNTPFKDLKAFGAFTVEKALAIGEVPGDLIIDAIPDRWLSYRFDEIDFSPDGLDRKDSASFPGGLLICVSSNACSHMTGLYLTAKEENQFPIEGARVTVSDSSLSELFTPERWDDSFYELLDGVHGPLKNGKGVSVMLEGDGKGIVRVSRLHGRAALVAINIK